MGPTQQTELEREVKFETPLATALPDLRDLVGRTERLPERLFATVYFDTTDGRLWERGITLRFRSEDGEPSGIWTLKLPSAIRGSVRERTKVSWEGTREAFPSGVIEGTRGVVRREPLRELVELDTVRQRLALHDQSDRVLGEIDDDLVSIVNGPNRGDRFRQVELELSADEDDVARSVMDRFVSAGMCANALPKVAVALGLSEQDRHCTTRLDQRSSLRDVLAATVSDDLGQLLDHDWRLRLAAPEVAPDDVHKSRVATRRLRFNLKTLEAVVDPVWARHVRDDLKWIGSALGDVRDADVLAGHVESGPAELHALLSKDRDAAVQRLLSALASDRYLNLLDRLHAATRTPPVLSAEPAGTSGSARERLTDLVGDEWRALRRRVRKFGPDPSDRQLHRIRTGAKRLRYAAEMAEPVIGKAGHRIARAAEELQTVLGAHHDAVAADDWLRDQVFRGSTASPQGISVTSAFVAGCLAAQEQRTQRKLRRRWPRSWKALRRVAKAYSD